MREFLSKEEFEDYLKVAEKLVVPEEGNASKYGTEQPETGTDSNATKITYDFIENMPINQAPVVVKSAKDGCLKNPSAETVGRTSVSEEVVDTKTAGGIPLISLKELIRTCSSAFKKKKWPSMYAHVQIIKKWLEEVD